MENLNKKILLISAGCFLFASSSFGKNIETPNNEILNLINNNSIAACVVSTIYKNQPTSRTLLCGINSNKITLLSEKNNFFHTHMSKNSNVAVTFEANNKKQINSITLQGKLSKSNTHKKYIEYQIIPQEYKKSTYDLSNNKITFSNFNKVKNNWVVVKTGSFDFDVEILKKSLS